MEFTLNGQKIVYDGDENRPLIKIFREDITKSGVHFSTPCLENERPTARCMVIVSPDAQNVGYPVLNNGNVVGIFHEHFQIRQ